MTIARNNLSPIRQLLAHLCIHPPKPAKVDIVASEASSARPSIAIDEMDLWLPSTFVVHHTYASHFVILSLGAAYSTVFIAVGRYDEVIHCVHYTSRLLATAGADGNVNILLPS
ncbi:unnamed protein product [Polarella glacialis]|uniref:Uncharacterized protein n=1 Tax=Polarella glacialis TaxID=89957 RepID=A0A813JME9_POLGL|nr:unnamed protein product [Polarella glacialis]CAE8678919.1 unnamed protein product [Polarella glacialis]